MLNSCVVVGKVIKKPEWCEEENGYHLLIECYRPFSLEDGTMKKDIMTVVLWKGLGKQCGEMCDKSDIVALKGRLESHPLKHNGQDLYLTKIIAEKLSFVVHDGKTNGVMY